MKEDNYLQLLDCLPNNIHEEFDYKKYMISINNIIYKDESKYEKITG